MGTCSPHSLWVAYRFPEPLTFNLTIVNDGPGDVSGLGVRLTFSLPFGTLLMEDSILSSHGGVNVTLPSDPLYLADPLSPNGTCVLDPNSLCLLGGPTPEKNFNVIIDWNTSVIAGDMITLFCTFKVRLFFNHRTVSGTASYTTGSLTNVVSAPASTSTKYVASSCEYPNITLTAETEDIAGLTAVRRITISSLPNGVYGRLRFVFGPYPAVSGISFPSYGVAAQRGIVSHASDHDDIVSYFSFSWQRMPRVDGK